jgi:hypothetical protein
MNEGTPTIASHVPWKAPIAMPAVLAAMIAAHQGQLRTYDEPEPPRFA